MPTHQYPPPQNVSTEDRPRDWLRSVPRRLRGRGLTLGALLLLTAALVAGLAVFGGGTVQADPVPGEVTNLRLSSGAPGELTITWDAPSDAPGDYRVSWARADLSWLSWNASNETHRGNSYPGGAGTSLTLTGLTGGERYKVRMRSRYNPGTSEGRSGPWTDERRQRVTAAATATAVPTAAPTAVPTPEPANDEVTNLRLSSDAAGELTITWDDPSSTPADYRITWAPAGEDYLSYSAENTERRGNSYPAGDVTTLTLTGLPGGATYKVMMRARYEDSSGPWIDEVTQRVTNNPLAAPTGLRTLATDQEITLEWDDPADDSITGYEIWRGPDASNLEVLAADTGSADNSYLDDAVTPETTYHYAIKAINPDGAGRQSDTISATTQAPPKLQQRDAEISVRQQMPTTRLAVSNIGRASGVLSNGSNGRAYATSFTTGGDPGGYPLKGARLNMDKASGVVITVSIYDDSSDSPGSSVHTLTQPSIDQNLDTTEEFAATTYTLTANTQYWLVVDRASGTGSLQVKAAPSTTPDAGGLPGWTIGNTQTRQGSASWSLFNTHVAMGVLVDFTPQLNSLEITSRPLDGDTYKAGENIEVEFTFNIDVEYKGGVAAIRVGDQTDNSNYRSAHNVGGSGTTKLLYRYKVKSTDADTTGIAVDGSALGTGGTDKIVDGSGNAATLTTAGLNTDSAHKVAGGTVGCEYLFCADVGVSELATTALGFFYYTSGNAGSLSNREFTLGQSFVVQQVVLRNGNQLEILLDRPPTQRLLAQATLHVGTIFYHFHEATVSGNRVTWPVTGLTWNDGDTSRITIQDDIFVSNLGKPAVSIGLVTDSTNEAFAQKFSTGSYASGYLPSEVELQAQVPGNSVVRLSIYDDFAGTPSESIYELTNPSSFSAGSSASAQFTATDLHLRANESYWLVWEVVSSSGFVSVSYATDTGQDRGVAAGWSIADSVYTFDGSTWSEHTISGSSNPIIRLSIRGKESRNLPATGTLSITGILEQGQKAAADNSGIVDPQGWAASTESYQWFRVDGGVESIISGATGVTYTIQSADVGKRLKAKFSFRDLAGTAESVTSDLTEVVSAASSYLVSNLGQSTDVSSEHTLAAWEEIAFAQDFTIGNTTGTFRLDAIRLFGKLNSEEDITVSIYSDSSGSPGSSLHVLTAPSKVDLFQETLDEFTASNVTLDRNTKYWVVAEAPNALSASSGLSIAVLTNDTDEDSGGETGSSIGNAIYQEGLGGWTQTTGGPYVLMMGIRGEVPQHTAPAFPNSSETFTVAEDAAAQTAVGSTPATDEDGDTLSYFITGIEQLEFALAFEFNDDTGEIFVSSGTNLDYETKSSYSIQVHVSDGEDAGGTAEASPRIDDTVNVTINLTNVEEPGSVSLSASQPQLGVSLTATLTDPDGGITGQGWQWARGDTATGSFANISGAASASYTPVQADVGKYLRVSATYTDAQGSGKSATKTADNAVVATVTNQAPAFSTNARTLTVAENAAANVAVGTVSATDSDGDTLTYSVSGTDLTAFNEDFTLNTGSGQVRVKSGATIDFENRPSYTVTMGVTDSEDPFGNASSAVDDTILVTINVTNREEAGTATLSTLRPVLNLPLSAALTDPDGNVSGQSWQWSRGTTATGSFSNISGATSSSYTPLQADVDRYLKVRVTYTDALSSGRSAEAVSANPVIDVPIDNVAPAFPSTGYTRTVGENAPAGQDLGAPITARDANRDSLTYSLGGAGSRAFTIAADTGQVSTGRSLNFEEQSEYVVTITARDPDGLTGTTTLTVNVTNVEEAGAVRISPGRPQLDNRARATVTDPDGGVRNVRWQWSRGDSETGPFSTISGATSAAYTTTDSDNGKFLRARATYTDTLGSGRSAEQVTSGPVMPDPFEGVVQFYPWKDAGDLPVGGSATGHIQGGKDADGEDVRDEVDYFELTGLTAGETHQITLVSSDAQSYHFTGVTYYGPASHLNHQTMGDFQSTGFTPGRRHILFTPTDANKRYFIGVKGHSSADHEYTLSLFKPAADDYSAGTSGAAEDDSFGSGKIERLYDIDWHRTANLSGSTQYLVALSGAGSDPLYDPVIHGVYDPSGNLIPDTSDTSSGLGKSSALVFTPESPGRYYVAVRSNALPWVPPGAPDPTGRGHTGSYSLTVGIINEPDNHHGRTTMRLGTANTPLALNQGYSQEFELEHKEDVEYIKVSVQENRVYEIYVHGVWDSFPSMSVFTQQDASGPFYPSIPESACWTTWHRVFATPESFSPSTYNDYVVKLTAGPRGAGTGTVTIKLIDNEAGNYRSHRDRCP